MRAAIPHMKAKGWGRIISTASAHSLVASPFKSAYVAAKHGIAGLTKTVALEVATHKITVNCISPGYVWTPLVEKQIPDTMKARGLTREQVINDVLLAAQPTKKFVTVRTGRGHGGLPLLRRGQPDHRRQHVDRRRLDGGLGARVRARPSATAPPPEHDRPGRRRFVGDRGAARRATLPAVRCADRAPGRPTSSKTWAPWISGIVILRSHLTCLTIIQNMNSYSCMGPGRMGRLCGRCAGAIGAGEYGWARERQASAADERTVVGGLGGFAWIGLRSGITDCG